MWIYLEDNTFLNLDHCDRIYTENHGTCGYAVMFRRGCGEYQDKFIYKHYKTEKDAIREMVRLMGVGSEATSS